MCILVIEDEPKLADYLHKGLSEQSHIVDVARDGVNGRHLALEGDYELVILDVMLPDIDGFAVLAALRAAARNTPVLMLTARDRVEDRVRGLEGGADDYLVKPFAFSELLARVHALQRRGRSQESTLLRLADLELDLASRKAQRGGRRLDLTAKEFSLLALLLRRQGQILSRTHAGRAGLGHELRQRHQRHRRRHPPAARQAGRPLRRQAAAYRARHGLRAGIAPVMRLRTPSMQRRLTLWLGVIALLASSLAGALLFWTLKQEVQRQEITEARGKAELIEHLVGMQSQYVAGAQRHARRHPGRPWPPGHLDHQPGRHAALWQRHARGAERHGRRRSAAAQRR
ncbi:two-component response regulator [Bordetella pertussis]|nr:two-component response regulator [Bordetella pertussis]